MGKGLDLKESAWYGDVEIPKPGVYPSLGTSGCDSCRRRHQRHIAAFARSISFPGATLTDTPTIHGSKAPSASPWMLNDSRSVNDREDDVDWQSATNSSSSSSYRALPIFSMGHATMRARNRRDPIHPLRAFLANRPLGDLPRRQPFSGLQPSSLGRLPASRPPGEEGPATDFTEKEGWRLGDGGGCVRARDVGARR